MRSLLIPGGDPVHLGIWTTHHRAKRQHSEDVSTSRVNVAHVKNRGNDRGDAGGAKAGKGGHLVAEASGGLALRMHGNPLTTRRLDCQAFWKGLEP